MAARMMSETNGVKILKPKARPALMALPLIWALLFWLKLTHVFSLVVESPSAAVGKGGDNQTDRFQEENPLIVQIVEHSGLRSKMVATEAHVVFGR